MKILASIRRLDNLGRVCLPIEMKEELNIESGQPIEIISDGESITLKKYVTGCSCCGSSNNVKEILGIKVCESCIKVDLELRKIINSIR